MRIFFEMRQIIFFKKIRIIFQGFCLMAVWINLIMHQKQNKMNGEVVLNWNRYDCKLTFNFYNGTKNKIVEKYKFTNPVKIFLGNWFQKRNYHWS